MYFEWLNWTTIGIAPSYDGHDHMQFRFLIQPFTTHISVPCAKVDPTSQLELLLYNNLFIPFCSDAQSHGMKVGTELHKLQTTLPKK